MISRFLKFTKLIYLTGLLGIKFKMVQQKIKQLGNVILSDKETSLIL